MGAVLTVGKRALRTWSVAIHRPLIAVEKILPPTFLNLPMGNSSPPCIALKPCGVCNVVGCPFSFGEEREHRSSVCGAEISERPRPFDVSPDTLFVAYSAWAEMTCFKVLGWKFPTHIFDQHIAYLAASNILLPYNPNEVRKRPRKGLTDACRAYGIEGWDRIDKDIIAKDIGEERWRVHGRELVFEYCEEDVRNSVQLLHVQLQQYCDQRGYTLLPAADAGRVIWWSNYSAKAVALIQARGMPIDVALWNLVQENKAAVIEELLRQFDPSHNDDDPIYTPDGEWTYDRLKQWLIRSGITVWPRTETGRLDTSREALGLMSYIPGIEELSALRDSINFIIKATLPIGQDGRNRPSLFPFGTATGRNAHAKSIYNVHAGMRSFIRFPEGICRASEGTQRTHKRNAAYPRGNAAYPWRTRGLVYAQAFERSWACGLSQVGG